MKIIKTSYSCSFDSIVLWLVFLVWILLVLLLWVNLLSCGVIQGVAVHRGWLHLELTISSLLLGITILSVCLKHSWLLINNWLTIMIILLKWITWSSLGISSFLGITNLWECLRVCLCLWLVRVVSRGYLVAMVMWVMWSVGVETAVQGLKMIILLLTTLKTTWNAHTAEASDNDHYVEHPINIGWGNFLAVGISLASTIYTAEIASHIFADSVFWVVIAIWRRIISNNNRWASVVITIASIGWVTRWVAAAIAKSAASVCWLQVDCLIWRSQFTLVLSVGWSGSAMTSSLSCCVALRLILWFWYKR